MLYLKVYRREKNPTLLEINNQPSCQMALLEKDPPPMQDTQEEWSNSWVRKITWKRKRQPALEFLPEKFPGQRSLVGYNPWVHRQLATTEQLRIQSTK